MESAESVALQIGNIVANAIIKNQSIYLPSIGSLRLDTVASKLNSRSGVITPPRYVVKFSSSEVGTSLVELISTQGGCDIATAESVYTQWIEGSKSEKGVVIAGVGRLANNIFTPTAEFNAALNPEAQKQLVLKRRRGGMVWIALSVVVCVCVGLAANEISKRVISSPKPAPVAEVIVVEEPEVVEVKEAEVETPRVEEVAPTPSNPRYRLVYGVFSTMENAQKAVAEVAQKSPSTKANVRPYGKYFMVNVVESDVVEKCNVFMLQHQELFPELWISKRRGE